MPAKNGVDGTLYCYPNSSRAQLIQISAQYGGSDVKLASDFEFGVTNKSPAFTAKFPFGQVPAFESSAGCLNDTMAIASFVGGCDLRGGDEITRATITQFMNMAETKLFPAACQVLYPCWGLMPNNKNVVNKGHENIKNFMTVLDQHLLNRTYLVGESVTLADLSLAVYMRDLYTMILDENRRNSYVNVTRWFTTIMNQDEVTRVLGQTTLCVKPAQFDAKLFQQNNPKQQKNAAPKKEAAKKEAPKKEEAAPAPKKERSAPFSSLPAPKLNMDDFKRHYWNDPSEVIHKYFDDTFVDGEWSVWKVEYKYQSELVKTTKTNNLVKGMFQRLETMKKYAFGLMYIFGDEGDQRLAGIWLGRGGDNFFYEDTNWTIDIENFNCTKMDMNKPDEKALWTKFIDGGMDDWEGKQFEKDHIF
ncbi:elongation factor 1-gamma-like [Bolinopsis microptera]|uniref:elongation factor 1-gamma-like n=1 Tax=Bolinopsis microptera TaxID=2820187 RepID=UPI003078FE15